MKTFHIKEILPILEEASDAIMNVYASGELFVQMKEDQSPVTIADTRANAILMQGLAKLDPSIHMITEEAMTEPSAQRNERVWLIDPLDGTREFIKRNNEFTICVALVENQRPIFGAVYAPVTQALYYASKGEGAFYRCGECGKRIHVSERLDNLRMLRSRNRVSERIYRMYEKKEVTSLVKLGSALKACAVAAGEAELYYSLGYTMEWDTAASDIIVHEAGGIFRRLDGELIVYNRDNHLNEGGFYVINREENFFL